MAKAMAVLFFVMLSVCVLSDFVAADDRHIDYGAIARDRVACSKKGESQNNCNGKNLTPANPYTRGCSKIAKCRGPNSVDGSDGQNQEGDNNEAAASSVSGDNGNNNNNENGAN